jgi:hypothetical protein
VKRTLFVRWIPFLAIALWPLTPPSAAPRCYPTSRFVDLTDGFVRDTLTNLVWQQDGAGTRTGCSGSGSLTCTWAEAQTYCKGQGSGFRLPTVKELRSIADFTLALPGPTINQAAFPSTPPETFWTSSPYASLSGNAWYVSFAYGFSYYDVVSTNYRVRCVR